MTISHLNGGNCTHEEAEAWRREFADVPSWDGALPLPVRQDRRLLGTKDHEYCICGTRLHEPRGEHSYCPHCRPRYDMTVAHVYRSLGIFDEEEWDVPNND